MPTVKDEPGSVAADDDSDIGIRPIDHIVRGRHSVVIQRRGTEYRWRCSCDRRRGCGWKTSEANVRWGGERHIAITRHKDSR